MPNDPGGDALHLAITSYYQLDVLLTWNCRHLANRNKMGHIQMVNRELGLPMPLLTTPLNYVGGDDANGGRSHPRSAPCSSRDIPSLWP